MKLRSKCTCKATGKLAGFTEMGDVNEEIRVFQDKCEERAVNVFMVSGIFSSLINPFGHFSSTGYIADQYPFIWEATKVLDHNEFFPGL